MTNGLRAVTLGWVAFFCLPGQLLAQQKLNGPQPPGGRLVSTNEDCTQLRKEWDAYKDAWGQQHEACLKAYSKGNVPTGPSCSKAPCQQLHYLIYEYADKESSRALDQCHSIVSEIAKQKREYEAAVRRYNEQVAAQNRRLLEAITRQNQEIQEQNRLAQEAVAERNRQAQETYESLVREYNFRTNLPDRANATLSAMRDALKGASTQLSNTVSNLIDELGTTSFGDFVNDLGDASDTFGQAFDVGHALADLDPPERVTSTIDAIDRFRSAWNMFRAGMSTVSNDIDPQQRFDDQISGLSSSTTFLFRRSPWAAPIVSDNIEGIGRWSNALSRIFDDAMNGRDTSDDQVKDYFARSFAPRLSWMNDQIKQIQGSASQLSQMFGR